MPLLKWSDEEDVIQRANDTRYGLGASVWGKDQDSVQRIGGHKESGIGCENSLHGLMEYTNWHTITPNKNWGKGAADKAA